MEKKSAGIRMRNGAGTIAIESRIGPPEVFKPGMLLILNSGETVVVGEVVAVGHFAALTKEADLLGYYLCESGVCDPIRLEDVAWYIDLTTEKGEIDISWYPTDVIRVI